MQHTGEPTKGLIEPRLGVLLALVLALGACTTTKRTAQLVIDHHVGMARGAWDIVSGKAEEREQRMAKLQVDLEQSRTALATETDPSSQLELLKQHVVLQDALIAELLQQGHAHHGGEPQAHEQSKTAAAGQESATHQH